MKFWIDIGTPKEVLFFKSFKDELEKRGHDVFVTSRLYQETNDLLDYFGITWYQAGKHGGGNREEKFDAGLQRMKELRGMVEDANALITLVNPEASRVAFGVNIPIYNFIDMPESDKVCRLSLPLSRRVYIPFHVKESQIRKYWDGPIFTYNALDPIAWMPRNPIPLKTIINSHISRPFVIYRLGETQATYYKLFGMDDPVPEIVNNLKRDYPDGTFLEVSRYNKHKMMDMQSLLAYADLFIGGGGTMNIEAAWWGTWTLNCRPIYTSYDDWLVNHGNQIRITNATDGHIIAKKLIERGDKNQAMKHIRNMKFPLKEIVDDIEIDAAACGVMK